MGVCKNRKLVHFSTDYVFDGTKGAPYNEEDICNPINTYGLAKRIGEALFWDNNNTLLIRTSWLYGENGKNFVNTIIEKAITGNSLKIVSDQVGSPTYTKDLVFATNNLLMANKTGIFHVTNRGCTSWYDFAVEIMKIKKIDTQIIPIKSSEYDSQARRPMNTVMDCCKFEEETGTKMRDWHDALNDYLNQ
jgi:dTDP-4-dehydrorhamnose reductase